MSTATDMLAAYIAAETAILGGQSYSINGHSYTYADLEKVQKGREDWQLIVNRETQRAAGKSSVAYADFTD